MNVLPPELVKAYCLFARTAPYPELAAKIRERFLEKMESDGALTRADIEREAGEMSSSISPCLASAQAPVNPRDLLIDLHFASRYDLRTVDDCINLVRKQESMRQLTRLLNRPGTPRSEILGQVEAFCRLPVGDTLLDQSEMEGVRVHLIRMLLSDHLEFIGVAKKHIMVRDLSEVLKWTIGHPDVQGLVGGKSSGLLLASRILKPTLGKADPDFEKHVTYPDTFYVTSTVFSDFLQHNDFSDLHNRKYRDPEEIRKTYPELVERFRKAEFPAEYAEQMRRLLDRVGERPLIVRSSSRLEDNSGFSFAGKYESIFVANQGPLDRRLDQLLDAVKTVYASIYGPDPIRYRRKFGMLDYDEHMAVAIQPVVGRRFGDWFFPLAAGVAYSRNIYRWSDRIRREDGFLRMVLGLGTRAVNRSEDDYARLVPLSHPTMRTEINTREIMKYSQRLADVVNVRSVEFESVPVEELLSAADHPDTADAVSVESEGSLRAPVSRLADLKPGQFCVTFDRLLRNETFVRVMKKVLRRLEECYGAPVDVEFAYDEGKIHILQCRILRGSLTDESVEMPEDISPDDLLFRFRSFFPGRHIQDVEYLVWVDPEAYGVLPGTAQMIQVARVVGALNSALQDKRYVLAGPGRWGSTDIRLGVRTTYADLCNALALGEIAMPGSHGAPEVSYGTHFFHDLVEANILPFAIVPGLGQDFLALQALRDAENLLGRFAPEHVQFDRCVKVIHLPPMSGGRRLAIVHDGVGGIGYFPDARRKELRGDTAAEDAPAPTPDGVEAPPEPGTGDR